MPEYDFECPHCNREFSRYWEIREYPGKDVKTECRHCGGEATGKDRIIGRGLKTTVVGVSKGNYNGNDTTGRGWS